ncbi:MAG: Glycosyltransferase AglD [Candidatus Methanofastidiosum methylothiophilum]|uniref:Glycosyltransferase AglD n=1 Tax=Candidatus Methanofastidiosum methylothiophilum TaxID=1705564 RepID=A0A150J099_9EURY|nr:MAG: Glycosyltransferase AglD [Candidatus Methanofastidiosum methylthiophilus]KYC48108.1 MAG: Glycosyltransferase AglD [Candidatus Methanofastidiosum methylthiophilus]KYC50653.1 MAG: Glycosyltransferase AglD [Candidatus Methanofastidiosum methylthiophilus]
MVSYKAILPFIAGIVLIFVFIQFVGYNEFITLIKRANPLYLGLALIFQILNLFFESYKWKPILESLKPNISIKNVFIATMIGIFFNNVTPGARTGGEPMKTFIISKEEDISPIENVFATVTVDRIVESLPFFILAIFAVIYVNLFHTVKLSVIFLLLFILIIYISVLLVASYICFNKNAGEKVVFKFLTLIGKVSKRIKKYEDLALSMVENFHSQFQLILKSRNNLYKSILASVMMWICWILRTYFVFLALGKPLNPILVALVTTISLLMGLIPFLPGGLGIVEVTMSVLYASLKVGKNIALTATILDRIISFWFVLFLAGIISSYNLPKFKNMKSEARDRMTTFNIEKEQINI